MRAPEEWDVPHNPAFAYYAYYVYANLYTLNRLREAKGMHAFTFRPHAGEAGDVDHLAAAFLLTKTSRTASTSGNRPCCSTSTTSRRSA